VNEVGTVSLVIAIVWHAMPFVMLILRLASTPQPVVFEAA